MKLTDEHEEMHGKIAEAIMAGAGDSVSVVVLIVTPGTPPTVHAIHNCGRDNARKIARLFAGTPETIVH